MAKTSSISQLLSSFQSQTTWLPVTIIITTIIIAITTVYIFYYIYDKYIRDHDIGLPPPKLKRYHISHEGFIPVTHLIHSFDRAHVHTAKSKTKLIMRTYHMPPILPKHKKNPLGIVLLCHDYGSHMHHLANFAHAFARAGFIVNGIDLIGFGESEGPRGYISDFRLLVSDIRDYGEALKQKYRDLPLFVGGIGMGAALSMCTALMDPKLIQGLVLLAPWLHCEMFTHKRKLLKPLSWICPRSMTLTKLWNEDMLTRNLLASEIIENDKLAYHGKVHINTAQQLIAMMNFLLSSIHHLSVPYHIQHGLDDMIASPMGSRFVYRNTPHISTGYKQVLWYRSCWHDLLIEPEAAEIAQVSVAWIEDLLHLKYLNRTLD